VASLVAEDVGQELHFYIKEERSSEGNASLWCVDKFYPDKIYRHEEGIGYQQVMKFLILDFKMKRQLQSLTGELMTMAKGVNVALVVYIRDGTEPDRDLVDSALYLASQHYKGTRDAIFTISDMKEGFEKELFDSLQIYDDHLPLVSLKQ